jgi:AcrR family transcriptional regulator
MPKVSDAHRESRREQIIAAALSCFAEKGFQRASMGDIVAASGLSAGAIYLHFGGKQEIALAVGRRVLSRRLGELGRMGDRELSDPIETLRALLSGLLEDVVDSRVLLQLWGEATVDPEMQKLVREIFEDLGGAWMRYLTSWAASHGVADPPTWARRASPAAFAMAQGFLVQRALLPQFDADAYFDSVRAVAGAELLRPR